MQASALLGSPRMNHPAPPRFGAADSQKRLEDDRLLRGTGLFNDDRCLDRECTIVFVRSPHAHARIVSIDTAAARAMPGVLAVYTQADLAAAGVRPIPVLPGYKRPDGADMSVPPREGLASDAARYVGKAVAAVVAETRAQAQDAAEAVVVDYEPLPAVVEVRAAMAPDAPHVWPGAPGNVAAYARYGDAAAVDAAFARAAHVTRLSMHNQRLVANPIEPRSAIARVEDGRLVLYTPSQTPTGTRQALAEGVFGMGVQEARIVVGDIGGGFGLKVGLAPEEVATCFAARALGRPVRWRADRSEDFLAAHQGREQSFDAALALDAEGRILAMRMTLIAAFGAEPMPQSTFIPIILSPKVATTVYHVPVVDYEIKGVLVNTATIGAYRGAGRPETNYLMERLIEQAAFEMKLDPAAIRRRNLIPPGAFPYRTRMGDVYDVGEFERVLDAVLAAGDWDGFAARKAESARRGRLRGRGLSMYLEWTGALLTETVNIRVDADGTVTAYSGTMAMGQGLETSYTQLLAEVLEIPLERIRIVQGDTDVANGAGSVGSRSAFVGGSAVLAAGRKVVDEGKPLAADALEAAPQDIEYRAGRFVVAGTDRAIGLAELAAKQPERSLRFSATENPSAPSWPNGAQVIEVEIDPETGVVTLDRIASVDDVGRIINRMIVEGQVQGGIAQGAGQALMEHAIYDAESGQLVTGSFMDYGMPRADDFPAAMTNGFIEDVPCKTNLLGAKGVGELGTIGAPMAIVHAVLDALRERGVKHMEMPLTPEKVWRVLNTQ
jgi:carbon-monoxide dehydrogenase large subunit